MSAKFVLPSILAATIAPSAAASETWSFHLDHVLGSSFDMAVEAPREAEARFAFAAAVSEISRLEQVLSGWRDDSELAALNRSAGARVSPDLFNVIAACESWRARTGGAFSARLGAMDSAWSSAAEHAPDAAALCDSALRASTADVVLDRAASTVTRPDGLLFAVDGLAKGYIIDAAMAAARRAAPCAPAMMIDIGGDVLCFGERAWRVGVADPSQGADNAPPLAIVRVSHQALAVSGPGARDRIIGEAAHSHLLDPRSGQPAPRRQAAVLAPAAAQADALATALAVMEPAEGLAFAEAMPGVEAMIVQAGEQQATSGWWAACQAAGAPLPAAFEVEVSYSLPKIEAANYRKPYLIAWVTDADKNPVKTLMILGAKREWQEDNYVWWRRYGRKNPAQVDTLAKPTRGPGKYSVGWDGTDAAGKRVAQGRYIIHLEAAREHGGHAYQTIEVNLGASPVTGQSAAKDELGAMQVRYGKAK